MSTYSYGGYEQERKRRAAEQAAAPKECPHCHAPINQHLSEWDKVHAHCGSDKCRKAASRANLAERKRQERKDTRARIVQYCETWLDAEQHRAVMEMTDLLMSYDYSSGHSIAWQVVKVIEAKRCKHDRISELEEHAALWKRRALASEEQLKARIAELEEEAHLFNALEATIHSIATRQLHQQPDPPVRQPTPAEASEPQTDPDRAHTLAVLAQAGIKPYGSQEDDEDPLEGYEDEDDTEGDEEEDPEE